MSKLTLSLHGDILYQQVYETDQLTSAAEVGRKFHKERMAGGIGHVVLCPLFYAE